LVEPSSGEERGRRVAGAPDRAPHDSHGLLRVSANLRMKSARTVLTCGFTGQVGR